MLKIKYVLEELEQTANVTRQLTMFFITQSGDGGNDNLYQSQKFQRKMDGLLWESSVKHLSEKSFYAFLQFYLSDIQKYIHRVIIVTDQFAFLLEHWASDLRTIKNLMYFLGSADFNFCKAQTFNYVKSRSTVCFVKILKDKGNKVYY